MLHRSLVSAITSALVLAAPASAAPVAATATLSITMPTLGVLTAAGSGMVDVTGGVLTVPAGLVSAAGPLVVPVTGTTAVNELTLVGLANATGTFSLGGVTAQAPGEICPGGLAPAGGAGGLACNVGGGLGGTMALTGTIRVHIIPNIVVIPFFLGTMQLGQGGSTYIPFYIDAAAWTTGVGLTNTGANTHAYTGFSAGDTLQLVTPLFTSACGNVFPMISALTISLAEVPEPAAWLSLWLGVLGIVWLTRRR